MTANQYILLTSVLPALQEIKAMQRRFPALGQVEMQQALKQALPQDPGMASADTPMTPVTLPETTLASETNGTNGSLEPGECTLTPM